MKVNVYAEEMEEVEEPTIVRKVSNGVEYHGLHFGCAEHHGVTFWFTSRARLIDAMYKALHVATNG